jgi:hypothetical protein
MQEAIVVEKPVDPDALISASDGTVSTKWKELVGKQLVEWSVIAQSGNNPFEFPSPTLASIGVTGKLINTISMPNSPSVAPNGDGGISFEWEQGSMLLHMNIDEQGNVETTLFSGAKIVYSQELEARFFQ